MDNYDCLLNVKSKVLFGEDFVLKNSPEPKWIIAIQIYSAFDIEHLRNCKILS